MGASMAELLAHISTLKGITLAVVQNNQEILAGTKEINDSVGETTELASRNESHISDVREALDKFRL